MAITLEWQVGDESIVADRHGTWRLGGRHCDTGEGGANVSEQCGEISGAELDAVMKTPRRGPHRRLRNKSARASATRVKPAT